MWKRMAEKDTEIRKLADELTSAEMRGDTSYLERNLSNDFVGIGPRGFVLSKEQWLARHKSGDLKYASLRTGEVTIHSPSGDTVIVTGKETSSVKYQGSPIPESEFRTMLIFVNQGGNGWRLAAKQLSPILPPPNMNMAQQGQGVAQR
jgi:hypothetical protein